jgi:DNA mismatch repair protein MSH6
MRGTCSNSRPQLTYLYELISGHATGSFGTHVASLAGVPQEVVERADTISKKFEEQFKARVEARQKQRTSSKFSVTTQADFVYLVKLATGQIPLPEDTIRQKHVLPLLKNIVRNYLKA